jgi:hypothetical protein
LNGNSPFPCAGIAAAANLGSIGDDMNLLYGPREKKWTHERKLL